MNHNIQKLLANTSYKVEKITTNNKLKSNRYAKNIYDFFNNYTKEQIDALISRLDDKDLEIFYKRYDTNYHNIPISIKDSRRYYGYLVPKMKNMLNNIDSVIYKMDTKVRSVSLKNNDNNDEYEYEVNNEYSYLKNDEMVYKILKLLEPEEVTIITLKFGLFNDRCFSVDSISSLLDVDKEFIFSVIENFLEMYSFYSKDKITKENYQKIK